MGSEFHARRWKVTAIAMIAVVISMALGWLLLRVDSQPGERPFSTAEGGARLTENDADRFNALESRLDRLALQVDRLASVVEGTATARGVRHEPESEQSAAEVELQLREQQTALANTFAKERVNPAWSSRTEDKLRRIGMSDAILAIEAKPPRRQSIECRTSHCRMEFEFADQADAEDWTLAYLTGLGGTLARSQYFVSRAPDGTTRITLYGQR